MELYRDIDIQAITDKLDQIVDEANKIKIITVEPTINECRQVQEVINDFILKSKRIVYGGTAYNELIKLKKKSDAIYSEFVCKDIDFYSPKPLEDLIELCDLLHADGFKYVKGSQAVHVGTYSIFVNFVQYCDISYMPTNVFSNMPTITIKGLLYSDPMWILVDILRQYNDPITSYWRLKDKTFFRASTLLKHYPLDLAISKIEPKNNFAKEKHELFKQLVDMKTLILVGSVAIKYYLDRSSTIDTSAIECYSINFNNDIMIINKLIEQILGQKYKQIVINTYKPFFQFRDEMIEYIIDNTCLLKIYGTDKKCLPYNLLHLENNKFDKIDKIQLGGFYRRGNKKQDKKQENIKDHSIKIGTFMLLFNNLLIERQYQYINRSSKYKNIETIMSNLLKARQEYLIKNSLTVVDNSPFKEFIIKCSGETIDSMREARLEAERKKSKGLKFSFHYDPATQKGHVKMPEHKFANISGNIDKSLLEKIFKKIKRIKN